MRRLLLAGLITAAFPLGHASAEANLDNPVANSSGEKITAKFVLRIGGLKVGKLSLSATIKNATYDSLVTMKAKGMAGLFVKANVEASSQGRHASNALQPDYYQRIQHKRKGPKFVSVTYKNGVPEKVDFDPPRPTAPTYGVSEENRRNTLDPVTAMLQMITPAENSPCERSYAVFDGKKRYDFHLEPLEPGEETMGPAPDNADNMIVCRGYYVRVDGFKPKDMKKLPLPPIDGWFTKMEGGRYWKPERFVTQTSLGTAILTTSRFEIGEAEVEKAQIQ